jgi:hypothetical protein
MTSTAKIRFPMWMVIALIHFGLSNLILPLTAVLAARAAAMDGPGFGVTLLVRLTKLLHLPLVTLALYPREWFPGNWVYVPMALDSLIWAGGVSWLIRLYRRLGRP